MLKIKYCSSFEKTLQELVVHLKSLHMTGANVTYLGPTGSQMGKKKLLKILQSFGGMYDALNIVVSLNVQLKRWLNFQGCQYGMA